MRTHLGGTSTGDDGVVLGRPTDDHDRVVQTALDLGDELLGAAAEDERACLGRRAVLEQVEPLAADLPLLEPPARAEVLGPDVGARGLDRAADGLDDALEVVGRDAAGAEDVTVGEELGREVADGQTREDDLGAGLVDGLELVEDDLPLGVDDGLVVLRRSDMLSRSADGPRPARCEPRRCRARP